MRYIPNDLLNEHHVLVGLAGGIIGFNAWSNPWMALLGLGTLASYMTARRKVALARLVKVPLDPADPPPPEPDHFWRNIILTFLFGAVCVIAVVQGVQQQH